MRKLFYILMLLPSLLLLSCDEKISKEQTAISNEQTNHEDGQCAYKKSIRKRNEVFPFNTCDRIEIVTYDSIDGYGDYGRINRTRTILSDSLGKYGFCERARIDSIQTDSLFGIIYNFEPMDTFYLSAACYNPRHAILFYKGKTLIEYFEICFECGGTEYLSKQSSFSYGFCNEQWCYLQQFFKNAGVKKRLGHSRCK